MASKDRFYSQIIWSTNLNSKQSYNFCMFIFNIHKFHIKHEVGHENLISSLLFKLLLNISEIKIKSERISHLKESAPSPII